jgi:hypothetical protein
VNDYGVCTNFMETGNLQSPQILFFFATSVSCQKIHLFWDRKLVISDRFSFVIIMVAVLVFGVRVHAEA